MARRKSTAGFKLEAEIQKLMARAIEADDVMALIEDAAQIREHSEPRGDEQFPEFSIDHQSRLACLRAGRLVLDSLSMLVPLTDDVNVSITAGEVLRPDFVCINPEQQRVIIFELKKEQQTGRQALTELLGYEQEIKNLLPFLSNYDIGYVLISPEWSTLMDHSVAAAVAWSDRNILCLEASQVAGELRLKTRIPEAWKVTGSVHFPEDALPCVTLCLYDKGPYAGAVSESAEAEDDEGLDPRIWTALEVIARQGDRMGGHGFALLWRDRWDISMTSYNITVCGVSPFAFYSAARERNIIRPDDGRLVSALDDYVFEHAPGADADSLMATATAANLLLEELSRPMLEGFSTWEDERRKLCWRAEPLLCEFWGAPGDFARSFVLNPAVRAHRRNLLSGGVGDWRDPRVGLPIVQSFIAPDIFSEGEVRPSDAFRFGVLIGLDRFLRFVLQQPGAPANARCRYTWNRIEMMAAIDEMRLLANAADNVHAPEVPFQFHEDPTVDDEREHHRFMDWLGQEFFQASVLHRSCFQIGASGALVFDNARDIMQEPPPQVVAEIADDVRELTEVILERARMYEKEGAASDRLAADLRRLRRRLGLRRNSRPDTVRGLDADLLVNAWPDVVRLADRLFHSVFHEHAPLAPARLDWPWLKQGVREMRERGIASAGVIVMPNGQIKTGPTMPPELAQFPILIEDAESQVPLLDRSHGFGVVRVVTWTALENGSALGPLAKADDGAAPDPR